MLHDVLAAPLRALANMHLHMLTAVARLGLQAPVKHRSANSAAYLGHIQGFC